MIPGTAHTPSLSSSISIIGSQFSSMLIQAAPSQKQSFSNSSSVQLVSLQKLHFTSQSQSPS